MHHRYLFDCGPFTASRETQGTASRKWYCFWYPIRYWEHRRKTRKNVLGSPGDIAATVTGTVGASYRSYSVPLLSTLIQFTVQCLVELLNRLYICLILALTGISPLEPQELELLELEQVVKELVNHSCHFSGSPASPCQWTIPLQ